MALTKLTTFVLLFATGVLTGDKENLKKENLDWKNHYGIAKQTAQDTKRPLVVVIEDPNAKKEIDEKNLDNKSKDILLKKDFELVRVNASTPYGKRVASAFGVTKLPYTAITNNNSSRIVYRKAGQMSQNDWTLALARSTQAKRAEAAAVVHEHSMASQVAYPTEVYQPEVYQHVVERPVVEHYVPQSVAPAPMVSSPVYSAQPVVFPTPSATQLIAPNGLFVLPMQQQCVT